MSLLDPDAPQIPATLEVDAPTGDRWRGKTEIAQVVRRQHHRLLVRLDDEALAGAGEGPSRQLRPGRSARASRAVAVLEHIAGVKAVALLKKLAGGAPSPLTT
jgi:hypothetical protein